MLVSREVQLLDDIPVSGTVNQLPDPFQFRPMHPRYSRISARIFIAFQHPQSAFWMCRRNSLQVARAMRLRDENAQLN